MTSETKSYEKVFYDLRPAKQVERRMMMDAFGRLMNGGVSLRDYQYTGMGSIYFFDFVLFYKLLGLRSMLSVEIEHSIRNRVLFNRPFKAVDIEMAPIGEVIPLLNKDGQHILWLDYDTRITADALADVSAAAFHLSKGSLLLVTVDAESPTDGDGPKEWFEYYRDQAGEFLPHEFDESAFALSRLADSNARIVVNAIKSGLSARAGLSYLPLFGFSYADGHEMITVGGMIGSPVEKRILAGCGFDAVSYTRTKPDEALYRIRVPRLTKRERLLLDQNMPSEPGWKPEEFELKPEEVEAYREIHQFYPHYGELLG